MFARSCALLATLALALEASCTGPAVPQLAATSGSTQADWVESCGDWDDWDKPGPPFRIVGNTYYVGTCGISAILVEGDDGLVLIDGGTGAGGALIAGNIASLGFELSDVKLILQSHEHFDHVGGIANLQALSGARVLASAEAAPVLASGVNGPDDPQAGMHEPFEAVRVDGIVTPGEPVRLGNLSFTPVATPGHTPGALSWQWQSCSGDRCETVVYADSLSPISGDDYRFSDHPEYVAAFRAGLERLATLDCDVLLTPHPSASDMHARFAGEKPLMDPAGCRAYAASIETRLDARLAEEDDG